MARISHRAAHPAGPPPTPYISEGANPQSGSPLFTTIPAEIRQRIYTFTLRSFNDPATPYNPQHHHYRPGHEYRQNHDFRLLRTCKRIYHEARLLPISLNEITIYLYRGPRSNPPAYPVQNWRERYQGLNPDQRNAVQTVHFYAQQCYLESTPGLLDPATNPWFGIAQLRGLQSIHAPSLTAKKFILTLRRSDWWSWESPPMSNDQLGICPWRSGRTDWKQMEAEPLHGPARGEDWKGWGGQLQHVPGLEMLEIEFEAVERKKRQLERVVERAKHWRFPLQEDRILAWTGELVESTWEGCVSLTEDYGDRAVRLRSVQQQEGTADLKPLTCPYVVMTMRWRVARREREWADPDRDLKDIEGWMSKATLV